MGEAFLGAYAALLVKTCHSRGAFAMGGMAAQIPVKNDEAANDAAFAKVRADKEREVRDGYDGTWVAHPDLVPVAREVFDRMMPEQEPDRAACGSTCACCASDLLKIHARHQDRGGLPPQHPRRRAIHRGLAARARRGADLQSDGRRRDRGDLARADLAVDQIRGRARRRHRGDAEIFRARDGRRDGAREGGGRRGRLCRGRFPEAIALFRDISLAPEFVEFLTIPAYRLIV